MMTIYKVVEKDERTFEIKYTLFRKPEDALEHLNEIKDRIFINRDDLSILYEAEDLILIGWEAEECDEEPEVYKKLWIKEDIVY